MSNRAVIYKCGYCREPVEGIYAGCESCGYPPRKQGDPWSCHRCGGSSSSSCDATICDDCGLLHRNPVKHCGNCGEKLHYEFCGPAAFQTDHCEACYGPYKDPFAEMRDRKWLQ